MNNTMPAVALIDTRSIQVPKESARERDKPSPESVAKMASSIQHNGLLHPIGVRPLGAGSYELIFGRRRLAACKYVSREQIEARVFDCTDEEAQRLRRAENIFRDDLSPAQRALALQRYFESINAALDRPTESTSDLLPPVTRAPHGALKEVAETSGESMKTVERTARAATKLTRDHLEQLDEAAAGRVDLDTIASLPDPHVRDDVVKLVVSGIPTPEAIARVTSPPDGKVRMADGRIVETAKTGEISDAEWIDRYCKTARDRLKKTDEFDRAVASYRKCEQLTKNLWGAIAPVIQMARRNGTRPDVVARDIERAASIMHPSYWLPCGKCDSTGRCGGADCDVCRGNGFVVKRDGIR